jgi:hypothetical protein
MLWFVSFGIFLLLMGAFALGCKMAKPQMTQAQRDELVAQLSEAAKGAVSNRARFELERRMRRDTTSTDSGK